MVFKKSRNAFNESTLAVNSLERALGQKLKKKTEKSDVDGRLANTVNEMER